MKGQETAKAYSEHETAAGIIKNNERGNMPANTGELFSLVSQEYLRDLKRQYLTCGDDEKATLRCKFFDLCREAGFSNEEADRAWSESADSDVFRTVQTEQQLIQKINRKNLSLSCADPLSMNFLRELADPENMFPEKSLRLLLLQKFLETCQEGKTYPVTWFKSHSSRGKKDTQWYLGVDESIFACLDNLNENDVAPSSNTKDPDKEQKPMNLTRELLRVKAYIRFFDRYQRGNQFSQYVVEDPSEKILDEVNMLSENAFLRKCLLPDCSIDDGKRLTEMIIQNPGSISAEKYMQLFSFFEKGIGLFGKYFETTEDNAEVYEAYSAVKSAFTKLKKECNNTLKTWTYENQAGNRKTAVDSITQDYKELKKSANPKQNQKQMKVNSEAIRLLRLCDDLSKGIIRANGHTRKHLYHLAAVLGMGFDPDLFPEEQEINLRLLYPYFGDRILWKSMMEMKENADWRMRYETHPVEEGINLKNYQELIYLWVLQKADPTLTAGEKIDLAESFISKAEEYAKRKEKEQANEKTPEIVIVNTLNSEPKTRSYVSDIQRDTTVFLDLADGFFQLTEDELVSNLVESNHYSISGNQSYPFFDDRTQKTAIRELLLIHMKSLPENEESFNSVLYNRYFSDLRKLAKNADREIIKMISDELTQTVFCFGENPEIVYTPEIRFSLMKILMRMYDEQLEDNHSLPVNEFAKDSEEKTAVQKLNFLRDAGFDIQIADETVFFHIQQDFKDPFGPVLKNCLKARDKSRGSAFQKYLNQEDCEEFDKLLWTSYMRLKKFRIERSKVFTVHLSNNGIMKRICSRPLQSRPKFVYEVWESLKEEIDRTMAECRFAAMNIHNPVDLLILAICLYELK